jgi:cation/acetate symporter
MPTTLGKPTPVAIAAFLAFVLLTLGITYWAARKTKTTSEFYAAGRSISGFQNGLALAGDFMSAASFLGIAGLVATGGYNGLIYSVGYLIGWPVVMFLIAEPLRNLGKYTFADVVASRLQPKPVRVLSAITTVITVVIYLVAQMVGAGGLIKLMFGLPYEYALFAVGALMIAYVLFGGMLATTWVQIIKAVLLLGGATLLVLLVMSRFGWSYNALFAAVEAKTLADGTSGAKLLQPGITSAVATSGWDILSLSIGLMFGTAGLPHILMRFYTVPDAREARKSVFVATGLIGYFYILTFTIGFAAAALVAPQYLLAVDKGGFSSNAAAPLLSEILGGAPFLGFLSAVAFATILAVVAGLTLAGASALSHDLYGGVLKKAGAGEAEEVRVARAATVGLGVLAVLLGLAFKNVNVAFMVGLAFAVAASANFPALVLSIMWRPLTTRGAVAGMTAGLLSSVILIVLSPTVWVDVFQAGVAKDAVSPAIFPWKNPTLISMPLAFAVAIIVSKLKPEPEAGRAFDAQQMRSLTGEGAE